MKKNIESLIKTLNKYEKHLNINLNLTCDNHILYDNSSNSICKNSIEFKIHGRNYVLSSNSEIDLEVIKIAIEEYLGNDNTLLNALLNEMSEYDYNQLKEVFKEEKYYLILIQSNRKNEYLYSTILNIFEDNCLELENNQIAIISSNHYDNQFLNEVKDTLETELYCKVYIAISDYFDIKELSNQYKELNYLIELSMKYKFENNVITSSNLLLPYIVDNISNRIEYINEYININKIKELDEELLMTTILFLKCNLSISETARKMYLHRNTLIYRIEKICLITGYDIRNFEDALKIAIGMIMMKK